MARAGCTGCVATGSFAVWGGLSWWIDDGLAVSSWFLPVGRLLGLGHSARMEVNDENQLVRELHRST